MRAIATEMIGTYPVGSVAWDYCQYALGLEQLGFEVYDLEDIGWQTYGPLKREHGEDCSFGARLLKESLTALFPNLRERWHFRAMDDTTYRVEASPFERIATEANLFFNVSGGALRSGLDNYVEI
jgi:hypothetical protein